MVCTRRHDPHVSATERRAQSATERRAQILWLLQWKRPRYVTLFLTALSKPLVRNPSALQRSSSEMTAGRTQHLTPNDRPQRVLSSGM